MYYGDIYNIIHCITYIYVLSLLNFYRRTFFMHFIFTLYLHTFIEHICQVSAIFIFLVNIIQIFIEP